MLYINSQSELFITKKLGPPKDCVRELIQSLELCSYWLLALENDYKNLVKA